jgi:hypothetical protein
MNIDVVVNHRESRGKQVRPEANPARLPHFDGFPYIWTRIMPVLYHISLVPRLAEPELRGIARHQALANNLPTCLVLNHEACYYYDAPDGRERWDRFIPQGGFVVYGKLRLGVSLLPDEDLSERQRLLAQYEKATNPGGYLVGRMQTRKATLADWCRLWGRQWNLVHRGLTHCNVCLEWKGEVLNPALPFFNQVTRVYCLCDNQNRCAACGNALYSHKLNACYYARRIRHVSSVPGFCAFSHVCPPTETETRVDS